MYEIQLRKNPRGKILGTKGPYKTLKGAQGLIIAAIRDPLEQEQVLRPTVPTDDLTRVTR